MHSNVAAMEDFHDFFKHNSLDMLQKYKKCTKTIDLTTIEI